MAKTEDDDARDTVPIVVGEPDEHGNCPVISMYEDRMEIGEIRPLRDGKPVGSSYPVVVSGEGNYKTMQFLEGIPPRKGPAKVNSPAFKHGWDSIFGRQEVGQA